MADTLASWDARTPVIRKSGDALIHVAVATSDSLRHLVPPQCRISEIAPGLSFYGVGVFKYREVEDLRPDKKACRWSNVFDVLVQVPVHHFNSGRHLFVHRLYNTNDEVVRWARGDRLTKTPCTASWEVSGSTVRASVERKDDRIERITLEATKRLVAPRALWKAPPLRQLVDSFVISQWEDRFYTFNAFMEFKRAYAADGSLRVEGLDLPAPLFGLSFLVEEFDPLYIGPIMTSFHRCSYGDRQRAEE